MIDPVKERDLKSHVMSKKNNRPDIVNAPRVEEVKSVEPPTCCECGCPTESPGTPKHLQCPSCHGGRGGIGKADWHRRVSGTLMRYRFVCQVCGFDWTADIRVTRELVRVEYQEPAVQTMQGPGMQTR